MTMKRKLLALTLTLAMALSVLTTAAFAEDEQDDPEMFLDTPVAVTWNGGRGSQFLFVAPETGYYTLATQGKEEYNAGYLIHAESLDSYPDGDSAAWTSGFTHFMLKGGRYVYSSGADREHGYTITLSKTMGFEEFLSDTQTWNIGDEESKTVTLPAATMEGCANFKAVAVHFPATGRYRVESGTTGGVGRVTCGVLLDETGGVVSVGKNGWPSLLGADVEAGKTYYLLPASLSKYETAFALGAEQVDPEYYCADGYAHDYEEEAAVRKATMTEDGWVRNRCRCGKEETVELPSIGSFGVSYTPCTYDGEEQEPPAFVKDRTGALLHWIYGHPQEVKYSDNVNVGTATAKITIDNGYYKAEGTVPFQINPLTLDDDCIHPIDPQGYTGRPVTPEVTVSYTKYSDPLVEGTDYTVSYDNNVGPGTATVTVEGKGNYTGTATQTFEIMDLCTDGKPHDWKETVKKATLTENGGVYMRCDKCGREEFATPLAKVNSITLDAASCTYDGKAKEPAVTVTNGFGDVLGSDQYKVTWSNNTNAGTTTAKVTLTSDWYEGTKNLTFQIKPATVSKVKAGSIKDQPYTGKALKPAVKLTFGGKTLTAGTDYTLTYKANKAVGTAAVTVTGKGNYTGTKKLTFNIVKAANPMTVKGKTATVKYSAVKKKAQTIAAKKAFSISKAQGKVTCQKSGGSKSITVSSAGKLTVKKGLKKGTYPVKVKVTAAGSKSYKAASKTITVTVKVK